MTKTFEKYPAYKDSGVEWIGKIPENWDLVSNKYIFDLIKNPVGKKSDDYELLSLTLRGLIKRDMENPEGKFPAEFDTYQEVKVGDFVFCFFDVEETPRTVGLSEFDGMITGAYTVLRPINGYVRKFLYYFYLNLDSRKKLRPLYKGLRNTIPKDHFFSFKTFTPPPSEQTSIANFLDEKTAKIDKAIAQKERFIELLKERKQIIIQNAVTKGLDPNAKMKDSGVEWIGEIPEDWEVKALKHLAKMESGETISSESFSEEGYPVYGGNGFRGYTNKYTNEGEFALIGRQGALCGNVNYATGRFFATEHAIVVYPKKGVETYWLGETIKVADLNQYSQSAAQPGISVSFVQNISFPSPPRHTQLEIAEFIKNQSAKIKDSIDLQETQIDKLKEYKSVLIDAAVTGKIKVA